MMLFKNRLLSFILLSQLAGCGFKDITNAHVFLDRPASALDAGVEGDGNSTDTDQDEDDKQCPDKEDSNCVRGCLHPLASNFNEKANSPGACIFRFCLKDHPLESLYFNEAQYYLQTFDGLIIHESSKCQDSSSSPSIGQYCKHPAALNYDSQGESLLPGPCYFTICLDPKYKEYDALSDVLEYVKYFGKQLQHSAQACKTLKD